LVRTGRGRVSAADISGLALGSMVLVVDVRELVRSGEGGLGALAAVLVTGDRVEVDIED
jgi:hypothetical protein